MRGVLVAIDLETTGLDMSSAEIIEIGAVKFRDNEIIDTYSTLVDAESPIPAKVTAITGIHQENLVGAPKLRDVLSKVSDFVGDATIVGQNIEFDLHFLQKAGILTSHASVDTYELASVLLPTTPRYNLNALMQELNLTPDGDYHRALADAQATAQVYMAFWHRLLTSVPLDVLQEIVTASQALPWKGAPVFADALQIRLQNSKKSSNSKPPVPATDSNMAPITVQPSLITSTGAKATPLDTAQLAALLEPMGKVTQAISDFASRPAQTEMLEAVSQAFNDQTHLLIEAPTGTGRTLAYLIPALTWAVQNNERVVIAVNSHSLQEQLIDRELPLIKQALGLDFEAAVLKRRSSYLCPRRLDVLRRRHPTSIDELRVFGKVSVWLNENPNGIDGNSSELSLRGPAEYSAWTRLSAEGEECTLGRCEQQMQGTCPFHKARRAAENAHLIVVNQNLLIADAINMPAERQVLPDYGCVIVDEAHNLEEAVTDSLHFRLDPESIRRQLADLGSLHTGLLGDIIGSTQPVLIPKHFDQIAAYTKIIAETITKMHHHINTLFADLRAFLETVQNLKGSEYLIQVRLTDAFRNKPAFSQVKAAWTILKDFIDGIAQAISYLSKALTQLRERYEMPHIDDLLYGTQATARHLALLDKQLNAFVVEPDDNAVYWMEMSADLDFLSVHGAPLNAGPLVKKTLWEAKKTVVMTGSTLRASASFEFIRQRLNAQNVKEVALANARDYEQSILLYLPSDMPEPQERNRYQQFVERGIIELAAATEGRLLALFTGYTALRQSAPNITARLALGNIAVFDQSDGTSRQSLLEGFKNTKRSVLLGTRNLWEEADLPTDDLSALVIVRLPFAVPSDPLYAARGEQYENSFNQYTVPDAILRFRQGFDQLLRTHAKRGVAAIFDKRMISKEYGQSFLESLPACTVLRAPMADLGATAKEWLNGSLP
ncbi:MAG: exonuclease domain-containing protein [Chloroflexota bacterium]